MCVYIYIYIYIYICVYIYIHTYIYIYIDTYTTDRPLISMHTQTLRRIDKVVCLIYVYSTCNKQKRYETMYTLISHTTIVNSLY